MAVGFWANLVCAVTRDGSGIFCVGKSVEVKAGLSELCEHKLRVSACHVFDGLQANLMEKQSLLGSDAPQPIHGKRCKPGFGLVRRNHRDEHQDQQIKQDR